MINSICCIVAVVDGIDFDVVVVDIAVLIVPSVIL